VSTDRFSKSIYKVAPSVSGPKIRDQTSYAGLWFHLLLELQI